MDRREENRLVRSSSDSDFDSSTDSVSVPSIIASASTDAVASDVAESASLAVDNNVAIILDGIIRGGRLWMRTRRLENDSEDGIAIRMPAVASANRRRALFALGAGDIMVLINRPCIAAIE
mmetsp:Transcript_8886/g.19191  ORF Transcript_8886/g.19191 Transcript_8886/m.19191 type:complete len:121 (-) Transcript_8886:115-477(-)